MIARIVWPLVVVLVVALTAISGVVTAVGQRSAPHPALANFNAGCESVALPCWRGITLGQTTLEATRDLLLQAGYTAGIINDTLYFHYFYSDGLTPGCVKVGYLPETRVLSYLRLYCIEKISFGDATAVLGSPQAVVYRYSPYGNSQLLSYQSAGGLSGVMLLVSSAWSSLYSPLASIELFEPQAFRRARTRSTAWRGFMPLWRYCRLEPDYPVCG
jgi:hypothetical protein